MEASETRGTTALVYCLISSSLYTGTVQGWWSTPPTGLTVSRGEVHPNWFDGRQGCSQLLQRKSIYKYLSSNLGLPESMHRFPGEVEFTGYFADAKIDSVKITNTPHCMGSLIRKPGKPAQSQPL